jgi:hypothetical protein
MFTCVGEGRAVLSVEHLKDWVMPCYKKNVTEVSVFETRRLDCDENIAGVLSGDRPGAWNLVPRHLKQL